MLSVTRTTWVLRRLLNKALFTRRPSFPCARDISGPRDTDSSSMSCASHCTRIFFKIKLSSYQHLCCIVSLIASFCSIKSPIFAVFIHISPCLFRFSICQLFVLICTPIGKTAEAEYYRRVAKAKERMGGKSLSGCRLELVRSLGRANFHIWKLASTSDSNYANLK